MTQTNPIPAPSVIREQLAYHMRQASLLRRQLRLSLAAAAQRAAQSPATCQGAESGPQPSDRRPATAGRSARRKGGHAG